MDEKLNELRVDLLSSFLFFTRFFFEKRVNREFVVSSPIGREPHQVTIARELTAIFHKETKNLKIHIPPRYGKTELAIHFVAWVLAHYPDSQFLYVSYSKSLATKQTKIIRDIVTMPIYKRLFGDLLISDSVARDDVETKVGGCVYAAGSGGTITGRGAGISKCDRFGGAIIIDDIHKPDEVESDTIREGVIEWYNNTMISRRNDPTNTPVVFIGQKLHERDLSGYLERTEPNKWKNIILPALDVNNNVLDPEKHTMAQLEEMQDKQPYVFASQYQQNPQPSGGSVFKEDDFVLLDNEPEMLATFITADTAETDKNYNDATVFSFWGIYKIIQHEHETDIFGLHWLSCIELRIEPKDLEREFLQFYYSSMTHKTKPQFVAIEKKSTGVTLLSCLSQLRGMKLIEIERTRASGSKTTRFLEIQPYIASKLISFTKGCNHAAACIKQARKITANNTHLHDDRIDTLYDAIKMALIDKIITPFLGKENIEQKAIIARELLNNYNTLQKLKGDRLWQM